MGEELFKAPQAGTPAAKRVIEPEVAEGPQEEPEPVQVTNPAWRVRIAKKGRAGEIEWTVERESKSDRTAVVQETVAAYREVGEALTKMEEEVPF